MAGRLLGKEGGPPHNYEAIGLMLLMFRDFRVAQDEPVVSEQES